MLSHENTNNYFRTEREQNEMVSCGCVAVWLCDAVQKLDLILFFVCVVLHIAIADLIDRSDEVPPSLRAIIASVLVPPYNSAQSDGDDVAAAAAVPSVVEHSARSHYIQMPAIKTKATVMDPDASDVDMDADGGAFTYNGTAGMVLRETTV